MGLEIDSKFARTAEIHQCPILTLSMRSKYPAWQASRLSVLSRHSRGMLELSPYYLINILYTFIRSSTCTMRLTWSCRRGRSSRGDASSGRRSRSRGPRPPSTCTCRSSRTRTAASAPHSWTGSSPRRPWRCVFCDNIGRLMFQTIPTRLQRTTSEMNSRQFFMINR